MHKMDYGLLQNLKTRIRTDDDYNLLKKLVSESKNAESFNTRLTSYEQVLNTLQYAKQVANKEKRESQKRVDRIRGEAMSKIVKPGMVVKCKGTKDGLGIREVLEVSKYGITARKIIRIRRRTGNVPVTRYHRDSYITTHGWDKVSKILEQINID